jgi:two-component system, chemotaxis family, chemotaxis protein CheY
MQVSFQAPCDVHVTERMVKYDRFRVQNKNGGMQMRVLIVEDDLISRNMLRHILAKFGRCDIAADGQKAVEAYRLAWEKSEPYDLICMDIMMPVLSGNDALIKIREIEKKMNLGSDAEVKVIMTTALNDNTNVTDALYKGGAAAYFVKPIEQDRLIQELRLLGLLDN